MSKEEKTTPDVKPRRRFPILVRTRRCARMRPEKLYATVVVWTEAMVGKHWHICLGLGRNLWIVDSPCHAATRHIWLPVGLIFCERIRLQGISSALLYSSPRPASAYAALQYNNAVFSCLFIYSLYIVKFHSSSYAGVCWRYSLRLCLCCVCVCVVFVFATLSPMAASLQAQIPEGFQFGFVTSCWCGGFARVIICFSKVCHNQTCH